MVVTNDKNNVRSDRKRRVGSFTSVVLELANESKDGDKANGVTPPPKGRIIRKLMGGGGGRSTKKYSRKGKLNETKFMHAY